MGKNKGNYIQKNEKCHLEFAKSGIPKMYYIPINYTDIARIGFEPKIVKKLDQKFKDIFQKQKYGTLCLQKYIKIKEYLLFSVKGMQHAALVTKTKMNTN